MYSKLMQRKNLKYLLPLLGVALIIFGFNNYGTEEDKEAVIFALVRDALTNVHLQPKEMDDALSEEIFDAYLEALDYNKLFLTQGEVDELAKDRFNLDQAFYSTSTVFFDKSYDLITQGIERSKQIYTELLAAPFDYTEDESIYSEAKERPFASNVAALEISWKQHLKWRILNRIYEKDHAQREDAETDEEVELKDFATLEKEAREKELELQEEWYDDLMDVSRIEWFGMYMNAYCETFDPHTSYLAPQQNENFELSMTGQFEGIGAQLKQEGDYIGIERIIAGSACWRQGDLEVGDRIIAVAQGSEEPVDVIGYKVREAVKLIRGKKGSEVRLTVKKKDGSRQIIPIIRDVVEIESTFARSAVLNGKTFKKKGGEYSLINDLESTTGYIKLPKFYVDFYNKNNRNAAEDVKAEIIKLKEQGVDGIILDLRSNGGGSLQAATEIAGLFTEKGPQVQVKSFQNGTRAKGNKDPNVYWEGPLVVLVNNYSASASEIVSAALQDRGRALIVGPAKSTFGKGTVQNMLDLDRAVNGPLNTLKPLGAVKITTEKFYRISGGTTQLQGVVPDISLPGAYDLIDMGEKEYDHALPVDYISKANYNESEKWSDAFDRAKMSSYMRVERDSVFMKSMEYAKWIKSGQENTFIPLAYDDYKSFQDSIKKEGERFKNLYKLKDSTGVVPLPDHLVMFETDSVQKDIYTKWYRNLAKDAVLREGVEIIATLK
jgi:carboxyl-terminal processing protease